MSKIDNTSTISLQGRELLLEYHIKDNSIHVITPQLTEIYGIPKVFTDIVSSLDTCSLIHPESMDAFRELIERVMRGEYQSETSLHINTKRKETRWIHLTFTTIYDETGKAERAIGVVRDISALVSASSKRGHGILYQEALMKDALLYYEADLTRGRVITGLEQLFKSLNLEYTDDYKDSLELICSHIIHPLDRKRLASYLSCEKLLNIHHAGSDKAFIEYRRVSEDGSYRWARCNVYFVDDPLTNCVKSCYYVYDNHEEKTRELELQQKAERDLLTGLYNKITTELLIRQALSSESSQKDQGAFFIIDLDDFKLVNDKLGHAFGDAVLSETAHKIQSLGNSEDIAGRIGGDEFVLFLKNITDQKTALVKANEINTMLRNAFPGALQDFCLSGTVGIALYPKDGKTFEELYKNADTALYSAKERGKDSCAFYDSKLHSRSTPDFSLATIDSSYRKAFSENISEYVFRILYEAREMKPAVNAVLELISNHFGFDRCYIYETSELDNEAYKTYEWCGRGTHPLPGTMNHLDEKTLSRCRTLISKDDFYLYSALNSRHQDDTFPQQDGLHFRFQCSLVSYGRFHGFAGFDQNGSGRLLTASDLASIRITAQMLGFFIETKHSDSLLLQAMNALKEVSDDIKVCTYMMDLDTYRLTYVHSSAPNRFPEAKVGAYCYEAIRQRNTPCEDCPVRGALREGRQTCSVEWDLNGHHMKNHMVFARRKDDTMNCMFRCYEVY